MTKNLKIINTYVSGAGLTGAGYEVFVACDFAQTHGTASVEFLRGDADFGSEAELCAVGKGSRDVCVDAGCVDSLEEQSLSFGILSNYALAVLRAMETDKCESFVDVAYGLDCQFVIEPFATEILVGGLSQQWIGTVEGGISFGIGVDFHIFVGEGIAQRREVGEATSVDNETVEGITYADAPRLGIEDDIASGGNIARVMKICMTYAGTCLYDGDVGVGPYIIDKSAAAARDEQVDASAGSKKLCRSLMCRWEYCGKFYGQALRFQHFVQYLCRCRGAVCRFASAFEDTGASCLETEREYVENNVRTGFKNGTYDAKGY